MINKQVLLLFDLAVWVLLDKRGHLFKNRSVFSHLVGYGFILFANSPEKIGGVAKQACGKLGVCCHSQKLLNYIVVLYYTQENRLTYISAPNASLYSVMNGKALFFMAVYCCFRNGCAGYVPKSLTSAAKKRNSSRANLKAGSSR